ncbi:phosphotransferase family protein [Peribacillus sp. SCS-26]|uniref:phosphotransferase family protein n=1 Tax=Paraperibacillus marinus TaxID=3115295 RepID=UPI003905BDFE
MTEKTVKEYLADRYGNFKPVRLTGGYTNETFLLEGTQPLLVAKAARPSSRGLENEIISLRLMEQTGVVPKIYDHIKENDIQISVMDYREGMNGQSLLDNNDIERTKELYKSLGKSLSESIHSIKYDFTPHGIKECDFHQLNFHLNFVPDHLIQTSKDLVGKITDRKEDWVLTHGDYGMHNVLYGDDGTLTVLDWEWAEWASPLTDIAWVCWFTRLHYPEHAGTLNPIFLQEYQKHLPIELSPEKLNAYGVYKVWKVLQKVQGAPKDAQEEWVRRLAWTIGANFI